jgi:hypothetical protein
MARDNIIHELEDWSLVPENISFPKDIDLFNLEHSLGVHRYDGKLWTSGYVGVGRLYDFKGNVMQTKGKEHIVVIKPQKAVINPWKMLEVVMADAEYESYIAELENSGKFLFKIFHEQPVIKLAQDSQNDGDLLYAISFISACYSLCKKGLRKEMIYKEENYGSKVKGKINVKKNIRENTCRGRNDRFYCKFIDFTDDNIENRILKATLQKSKKIIEKKIGISNAVYKQYQFCMNALKHVRDIQIKSSDFSKASASGLYMYYKPVLKQAKAIYGQKYLSYKAENGETVTSSVYTTPYIINMETLFEFYVRALLRKSLPSIGCELVSYSEKICLEDGINNPNDAEKGIHLMPYCIPDIIVRNKVTQETVSVMDVKYKNHERASRSDSLQLLSYVLLTGVKHCGFIFPNDDTQIKMFKNGGSDHLKIRTPFADELKYFELLMGNEIDESVLRTIIS